MVVMSIGGRIGYADPKSLASTNSKPCGALEEFRPHVFLGVPKIYETLRKGIMAKISSMSGSTRDIVEAGMQRKIEGCTTPLYDLVVFSKFREALGGRIMFLANGGGPLSPSTQKWIEMIMGVRLCNGYGLTETCSVVTITHLHDTRHGIAGWPVMDMSITMLSCTEDETPTGEATIRDANDRPYLSTDRVNLNGDPILGRGEIVLKSPTTLMGYIKQPELTKEAFKDGWFRTGDVGELLPDGCLRIVDRVKNLVKLRTGEYISLESMEGVYAVCEFVDTGTGGIMVHGSGEIDKPVAFVQISAVVMRDWLEKERTIINNDRRNNITEPEIEELKTHLDDPKFNKAVLESLHNHWKIGKLNKNEKLCAVGLLLDPWTSENGCLSAANKLLRKRIFEKHQKLGDELCRKAST